MILTLKTKLDVGIIGGGGISATLHLPLLSCINNVNIKYVADVQEPKDLAKVYKIQSIKIDDVSSLPDCDIVLLATPVGVREKYITEFSKRKTPIFSEKPFAVDLETHNRFLGLSDKITCNYMKIYYNSTKQIKAIVSSGLFGKLKKIIVTEGGIVGKTNRGKDTYQADSALSGGGILIETACHTLSQLASIFDNISVRDASVIWENNFDVEATATFDVFEKNPFTIDYTITMIRPIDVGTTLFFDNAKLTINHTIPDSEMMISGYTSDEYFLLKRGTKYAATANQAYYLKWKSFLDSVANNEIMDTKKETSIKTTELITEIYKRGKK